MGILNDCRAKKKIRAALLILWAFAVVSGILVFVGERYSAWRRGDDSRQASEVAVGAPVSGDAAPLPPGWRMTPSPKPAPPTERAEPDTARHGTFLVIDKSSYSLVLYKDGKAVKKYRIAVGRNTGDKARVGDMRTPEGEFPIVQIQKASSWTHDFGDGKGQVKGAYGPYFIRLGTPGWSGIGIHGTHAPGSIGTNVTEGCIRLNNRDLLELRGMVGVGDRVVIRN
ncbi:MAG: L,D-transpeptidase [Synergistaceae bacterium]|nr:L,D-transpeptidase [Synergistaceae bacterium]